MGVFAQSPLSNDLGPNKTGGYEDRQKPEAGVIKRDAEEPIDVPSLSKSKDSVSNSSKVDDD